MSLWVCLASGLWGCGFVGALAEGEHRTTKNRIVVQHKVDRKLLVIMFDQTRQILQVRADKFGTVPTDDADVQQALPHSDAVMLAAIEFFKPIFKDYIEDKLKGKRDLYKARDARLLELGLKKKAGQK